MIRTLYQALQDTVGMIGDVTGTGRTTTKGLREIAEIHINMQVEEAKVSAKAQAEASKVALAQPGEKTKAAIAQRRRAVVEADI